MKFCELMKVILLWIKDQNIGAGFEGQARSADVTLSPDRIKKKKRGLQQVCPGHGVY